MPFTTYRHAGSATGGSSRTAFGLRTTDLGTAGVVLLSFLCLDFLGGLAVVEIAALQGQTLEKGAHKPQKYLQFRYSDEVDGLAIGLQGSKSVLFVDFRVVVQGAEHDFVVLGELLYLVESPQLVAFFKRIGYAGQKDKDFHLIGFRGQR